MVEIAPEAKPPVCKVMDFGKYRFEKEKREKEQRKKRQIIELKEIQLKCRIDTHDFNTKLNHTLKFLAQGNKVKVIVKFFGREMAHTELGKQLMDKFLDQLTVNEMVMMVIDGGYGKNIPSTVVDCTTGEFEVIRQGEGDLSQYI